MAAPTVATLAELRVRQGRLPEAEQLLVGREEHPESLRALAHLRVAQGRPAVAAALLERGLLAADGDTPQTAQLLAALVDARIAQGAVDSAATASGSLTELAGASGSVVDVARAELAAARCHVAAGRPDAAAEAARRSLAGFGSLGMPYETAEARLELARALAGLSPELAVEEARAAHGTFRELGATRARDAAAAALRELGTTTGPLPRAAGELTAREQEVLGLLALGMSNGQIAETLVISEKTAGHHVSRILGKLGVRNRAEAAALAARGGAPTTAR
jgi:DNA-binding NarL/FixJ family response regulator